MTHAIPTEERRELAPLVPTIVFNTYWRFAAERQEIFFRRIESPLSLWTKDPILARHKFTNAYRASDRVSQFLIRNVIYRGSAAPREVFFRIILFKLFNRIETWQLLERDIGELRWKTYRFDRYVAVLERAMSADIRIYSAAYIMPTAAQFGGQRKHETHLRLLEHMINEGAVERILNARTMRAAFEVLRSFPMMGDFLAYQFITDLNYSDMINFSEMEFVVPGPGARDGLRKCFSSFGGLSESDIIRIVAERQCVEFDRLGLHFRSLWGRALQLIDCQNLFCEVDKYARVAHPEIVGISGRTKIKQIFDPNPSPIHYWYPPKWGINDKAEATVSRGASA
ncbi:nucleotide kinase domain-containing protein [Sorangium sp. So ce1182]|uniref:nucleotide kinase domain-containing protein n=1 Tax=Sorangium sp. So ce1182 TaxID=3133334 RepID=UPI003F5F4D8D